MGDTDTKNRADTTDTSIPIGNATGLLLQAGNERNGKDATRRKIDKKHTANPNLVLSLFLRNSSVDTQFSAEK